MKRTGEIVLSIIGAFLYALMAGVGVFMIWLENNRDLVQGTLQDASEQNPDAPPINMADLNNALDFMGNSGTYLTIISIIAIIVGIISILLVKGNKKPKVAGIILIVTALAIAIFTFGGGILAGIFYLIAGIMCLVRKPKKIIYE
ncbi:DUF4064 domain-containing protein [Virgibacillus necropolis]|uniref:DUF4064 domain-containing protein n=1 Tax=Virgibacillus necropolis TaxID=163877 RepID=UPI00384E82E2